MDFSFITSIIMTLVIISLAFSFFKMKQDIDPVKNFNKSQDDGKETGIKKSVGDAITFLDKNNNTVEFAIDFDLIIDFAKTVYPQKFESETFGKCFANFFYNIVSNFQSQNLLRIRRIVSPTVFLTLSNNPPKTKLKSLSKIKINSVDRENSTFQLIFYSIQSPLKNDKPTDKDIEFIDTWTIQYSLTKITKVIKLKLIKTS
ncbi:MAG: hypothetical protein JJV96_03050 [Alphaproteobacteria bacterium]|nr:hypothetical protein [Alphaproteobacteria bacterium]